MIPVYLIGGGWNAAIFPVTYGRFVKAAAKNGRRKIAVVVASEQDSDPDEQFARFLKPFVSVGLDPFEAAGLVVSKDEPLTVEKIARLEPTAVFVCGGLTPAYYDALCLDKSWLAYLFENEISYAGFSAGASIAAKRAIIGGWRREIDGKIFEIGDENAAEDLDLLDVREGLGLVDFTVDVHATQWGTVTRLLHAVDAGLTDEGRALDENILIEVGSGEVRVFGAGSVYRVGREKNGIVVFRESG
jgi:cyanophycinase